MIDARWHKLIGTLYARQPVAVDFLPYSKQFDAMHAELIRAVGDAAADCSKRSLWMVLMRMRKRGTLPKKTEQDGRETIAERKRRLKGRGFGLVGGA